MTQDRYRQTFQGLRARREGAFVPFTVLGDPDPETSLAIVRALVRGGADALELGIPFSDPVADGPVIQAADVRALAAGVRPAHAWEIVRAVRAESPALPIGLLVYANLVEARGREPFYRSAAEAGVDSILVADVPTLEAVAFAECARRAGVQPVLIATPNSDDRHLQAIARLGGGYTYVVTRVGVTGADREAQSNQAGLLEKLRGFGAPPALVGFGVSRPEHVRAALADGAVGAICGSAIVRRIEQNLGDRAALLAAVEALVRELKAATFPPPEPAAS